MGRRLRAAGLALVAAALPLALVHSRVWPLGGVFVDDIGGDHGMFTWNLWHATEAVLDGRNPYHTDLVYYPVGGNLARHTYAFGFVPVGLAAKLLTRSPLYPVYAYRAAIWLSFVAGVLAAYAALRRLGSRPAAALWGGVAFPFACCFLGHVPHLNILAAAFLLPGLTGLAWRAWTKPSPGAFVLLVAALGLSVYFGEFSLFAGLALAVATVLLATGSMRGALVERARAWGWRGLAGGLAAALLAASPFLANFAAGEARAPKARASYRSSADVVGFVVPSSTMQPLYAWMGPEKRLPGTGLGGREVFLGFPVLLLLTATLVTRGSAWRRLGLAVGGVFLVLALGPELHVAGPAVGVPLPYRWLMAVPPFDLARTPVRLFPVGLWLCVVVAAGTLSAALSALEARGHRWAAHAIAALRSHGPRRRATGGRRRQQSSSRRASWPRFPRGRWSTCPSTSRTVTRHCSRHSTGGRPSRGISRGARPPRSSTCAGWTTR